ncbi:MAG TPA: HEAT repeat domain-containing protein [Longimicrobiaceae bacterium]
MSTRLMRAAAVAAALAGAVPAACAGAESAQARDAQSGLAARVDAAPDGEVWMHFASRPGVCGGGDDNSVNISTERRQRRSGVYISDHQISTGTGNWECVEGPVWVALEREGGRIENIRVRVARGWSREGHGRVTDLGAVGAREASDYLLGIAERSTNGHVGEKALLPATLADSVTTWPALLRIARRDAAPQQTRRSAVFWLSQQAGDHITRDLGELVNDDDEDREVRKQAVFALSQRPHDEAVPELIRIARTHRDPEIRKTAMFWLGQTNDPRAVALFEEILRH